jgi:hypothetical protein
MCAAAQSGLKSAYALRHEKRAPDRARQIRIRRTAMKAAVVIDDLPAPTDLERKEAALTPEKMKRIFGGRVAVTVDGARAGTVDEFGVDCAIFEGRIKGAMI